MTTMIFNHLGNSMQKYGMSLCVVMMMTIFSDSHALPKPSITLSNCHVQGIKQIVQCGSLQVPENYEKIDGEQISINIAIIPAIDSSKKKEPFMFLAGGPGQAAVEIAAPLYKVFTEIRKDRDIILIDQRGTGNSHPLTCDDELTQNAYTILPEDLSAQEIRECIDDLSGDLSQYTTENAIRDFDAVRDALGHPQINLYGGSYGTRAALVYMRLFPQSIRSVVLDSVGPIEIPIGAFGQSSSRSFALLLEHCQQDSGCKDAFPDLLNEFNQLIERLEKSPITVDIRHPRLGTPTSFVISKSKFISNLRLQLYAVKTRNMVPLIIHQAYLGNYLPLAGLVAQGDGQQLVYMGLTFNIVCNEDYPKITDAMFATDADNIFGGDESHAAWKKVCPLWPQYRPQNSFYASIESRIPTLILSGDLDPVTPPSNGELAAKTLVNSHHIIVKNTSHTVAMSSCAPKVIKQFLTSLSPKELDESCFDELPDESFMTSLNGSV